jgi:hypothetical protein
MLDDLLLTDDGNQEIFSTMVTLAQIVSRILKAFPNSGTKKKNMRDAMTVTQELDHDLRDFYDSLPEQYKYNPLSAISPPNSSVHPAYIVCLRAHYKCAMIMIHTPFCYPWNKLGHETGQDPVLLEQKNISSGIVAAAARDVLTTLHGLKISPETGACLTTFYPLFGLIHLFLHLIEHSDLPTTSSDLSLLDTVIGHFGYLDFIGRSQFETHRLRQVVSYARETIRRESIDTTTSAAVDPTDGGDLAILHEPFDLSLDSTLLEVS